VRQLRALDAYGVRAHRLHTSIDVTSARNGYDSRTCCETTLESYPEAKEAIAERILQEAPGKPLTLEVKA